MVYVLLAVVAALFLSVIWPVSRRIWRFYLLFLCFFALWLLERTRLRPLWRRVTGQPPEPLTNPVLARRLCEEMGPTFIKFGQIVASSAGLFPRAYVDEFARCLDRVPPFPFAKVRQVIAEELGERASELGEIEETPLASASIAQVHGARLADGTEVVVKVQRPGIPEMVGADVQILRWLARVISMLQQSARAANPVAIVEDFAVTISEELDFRREAENLARFNEIMAELGYTDIRAPVPQWGLSGRRLLVMERFRGVRVDNVEEIRKRGIDAEATLIRGLRAWFQTVVFYGFFHGDVHAGNLFLLDGGGIGFLDFGIVGRYNDRQRYLVTDYMMAFSTGNFRRLAEILVQMGGAPADIDIEAFAKSLGEAYGPMLILSFGELDAAEIIPRINEAAVAHKMVLPREFVLITKQLLYFDRYARLLTPHLNVFTDPRILLSLATDIQRARAAGPPA